MLSFARPTLDDRLRVKDFLAKSNFRGCEYTFGNMLMWSDRYNTEICLTDGYCFEKIGSGENTWFIFPSGSGEIDAALAMILEYAAQNNFPAVIWANAVIKEKILSFYPAAKAELNRDICDYVYSADDLANLCGRKYHGKRNHLHRFYENNWSFEPLSFANIRECAEMLRKWESENITDDSADAKDKMTEIRVVKRSLDNYEQLDYTGGILRVEGEVQAFTFGEPSADDTFVVHAEKALRKYQGAYTAINREFVNYLGGKYKYINREDDSGSENLRKAKLSYYPVFLEEKYLITI